MRDEYWKIYYDEQTLERGNKQREEHGLFSAGVKIHIDVYAQPKPGAPVVVFNHGAAGYCRLFVNLALAFHDRGYTVVLPDQKGQGFSEGRRGDYTISECVRNIVDVCHWARQRYEGPLFLAGGSVGGGLAYYAAAAGAKANAAACLNLFDFGVGRDGLGISRLAGLAKFPGAVRIARALAYLFQNSSRPGLPFGWAGAFEKLMDERDRDFQAKWDADPVPPRRVSPRSLASALTTPPAVPFEKNRVPILVINQARDRMVDPEVTRRNFARLSGPRELLEIPFGHWSAAPEFWDALVNACDNWFQRFPTGR
ncbi:MAG: alpha/beta fold hydrolase [Pseudomonadota bacterium]